MGADILEGALARNEPEIDVNNDPPVLPTSEQI